MKKLLVLMKKEFFRFFHDPRLIITMLLPGLLIFAIYSIMGSVMNDTTKYDFRVYVQGESQTVSIMENAVKSTGATITITRAEDAEAAKKDVKEGNAAAFLVYSENFDSAVEAYDSSSGEPAPKVEIYYRSGDEESLIFYNIAAGVLDEYERAMTNKFDVNPTGGEYDFSEKGDFAKTMMSGLLPFLVIVLIFSSSMSITLEAVAGEKERGTLATVLVTSVKRSHVALGKILPLSCISAIGGVSSFLGVILSMPKLMGTSLGAFAGSYGFLSYFFLFLLVISIVPLIVSIMTVLSTYARSVKEASAYTGIVMILVMVISLLASFLGHIGNWAVAVPVLNTVVAFQGVLLGTAPVWLPIAAFAVNLAYTSLLVLLVAKMLSSEKIMFGK